MGLSIAQLGENAITGVIEACLIMEKAAHERGRGRLMNLRFSGGNYADIGITTHDMVSRRKRRGIRWRQFWTIN
jgi:hypothetical protein